MLNFYKKLHKLKSVVAVRNREEGARLHYLGGSASHPSEVNDMPLLTANVFVNCKASGMDEFLKSVLKPRWGHARQLNCCPGGIVPKENQIEFSSFSSFGLLPTKDLVAAFFSSKCLQWVCDLCVFVTM